MSTQRQIKFESLCRLCTSLESNNLHIFGDEGEGIQLASKIRICLPIFVHREDTLPKVVCLPCVSKLESFYSFREACVKAEGTLEAFLKEEQNFPHEPEVCLEEDTSAKSMDSLSCENVVSEKQGKKREARGRGRKKKGKVEDVNEESKASRRGKRRKVLEAAKDEPCVQLAEVNVVQETSETLGELPIPLSSNLSQVLLPQLGDLHPEDYLLIKEEKFLADANWNVENLFPPSQDGGLSFIKEALINSIGGKDGSYTGFGVDTFGGMKTEMDVEGANAGHTRQFLPPVWDIFEKVFHESKVQGEDAAIITHRRYIVGKRAFPCALCGNCFLLTGAGNVLENGRSSNRSKGNASTASKPPKEEGTERPYSCLRCGKRYFRRSDLVRHEKTHLDARPFVCRLCGKGFCRKEHAQRHMSLHVGEKPFRCDLCLKFFTRKEHLARHKRCHHPEGYILCEDSAKTSVATVKEEPTEAAEINKTGVTSRLRQRNTANKSKDQKVSKGQAQSQSSRNTKKIYQCEICIRPFSRREHLVRHRRSHFRDQIKATSLAMASARHQLNMHDKTQMEAFPDVDGMEGSGSSNHSCRFCTLAFSCKEQLDRHTSRMHPLEEAVSAMSPPSPIDESQSEDFSVTNLNSVPSPSPPHLVSEHSLVELIDKVPATKQSFSCILCPQTFSRKENVERHLKSVHAGLKPYACNICGKRFGRAEQCRRHGNRHQQNEGALDAENNNIGHLKERGRCAAEPVKGNTFYLRNECKNKALETDNQKDEAVIGDNVLEKSKRSISKGTAKNESLKHGHHSKRIKSYSCHGCGSIFSKKKHLAKHKCTRSKEGAISK